MATSGAGEFGNISYTGGFLGKILYCTVKKVYRFPRPRGGMSLAKLSLAGKNLIILGQGEFMVSDTPPMGTGKSITFFTVCTLNTTY